MLGDGVLHPDGIACRPEAAIVGAVDEAEVDDFLVVARGPAALERQRAQPRLGSRAHGDARLRRPGRDVLIAVQADHFLDQVLLDGDVEAPRRRRDLKDRIRRAVAGIGSLLLEDEAQAPEGIGAVVSRQRQTTDARQTRQAHGHRLALGQPRDLIADRTRLASADLQHQTTQVLQMLDHRFGIHAALEALGGIGGEVVAARPSHDGGRPPEGSFQIDIGGLFCIHRAALPAHDAGQAHRTVIIADHARRQTLGVRLHGHGLVIEQRQLLAGTPPADVQTALQACQIEDVRGTTQFQQHIVGDVDQRRDGALTGTRQPLLHPVRRGRRRIDAANDTTGKASAQFRLLNADRQDSVAGHGHGGEGRFLHGMVGQRAQIARHAQHRHAVRQVRRELQLQHVLVQVQCLAQVGARLQVGRQLQDAAVIVAHAQLTARAQHATTFLAAHLRLLDAEITGQHGAGQRAGRHQPGARIGRTADDLHRLGLAHVHHAHLQAVGVRVLGGADDARDHHAGERGRHWLAGLHFHATHGQQVLQCHPVHRRIAIVAQPFLGNSHDRINTCLGKSEGMAGAGMTRAVHGRRETRPIGRAGT